MSNYYKNVYQRRLNRYGLDYQSRIQNQRERDFDNYLYKTIYRVDFEFNGDYIPGSLERYKQDSSETQGYLLTKREVQIPNGTVLMIQSKDNTITPWMVWWLEQIEASGYNRYVVLKMTHFLQWKSENKIIKQWAYFLGPGAVAIADAVRTTTGKPTYSENNNLHLFITTQNDAILRDQYLEVIQGDTVQAYVIEEFDINSTPGVSYITVDPVPVRAPKTTLAQGETDNKEDFFWLQGGIFNGST